MDIASPTPLLGGLSPSQFMRRHWQKKPLLVRAAYRGGTPPIGRAELFELAAQDEVASRLVVHDGPRWTLARGPFKRRALPPLKQRRWTLLVQGVDLHLDSAHRLLSNFRFVPDARLDDLMVSYATDGGGVGPHVDSYDVFLLQLRGRRRWRVGRTPDARFREGLPLKILRHFEPEYDWLLEPGDMLYLPPGWGHDGVAVGECMTASIGFRAAGRDEIGQQVLQRMLDAADAGGAQRLYRDPGQAASDVPARIPPALQAYALDAVARLLTDKPSLLCSLGEWLSEPSSHVAFDVGLAAAHAGSGDELEQGVELDKRTRMLYDERFVFINGESYRAAGADAVLMRRLADKRQLDAGELRRASAAARELLAEWLDAGWVNVRPLE